MTKFIHNLELNPSIYTDVVDPGKIPTLSQFLAQPLFGTTGVLLPTKVKMMARRSLRCVESDSMIYKGEYGPTVVKPKLQVPSNIQISFLISPFHFKHFAI